MITCRDIITLGLQQARIVPLGREPKAKEADAGMTVLQSLYDSMFADGPLGPFTEVYATSAYTAKENERIVTNGAVITIPQTITEGSETRKPYDLTAVIVINGSAQENNVFSLGRWQTAHDLTLNSEAPLAERDKAGLAALFAMEFAEMFGAELPPRTTARGFRFKGAISQKLATKRDDPVYY